MLIHELTFCALRLSSFVASARNSPLGTNEAVEREAIARILGCATGSGHPCYELGGPRIYTFTELVGSVAGLIGTYRLIPLPFVLWEAVALLCEFAPGALLMRN